MNFSSRKQILPCIFFGLVFLLYVNGSNAQYEDLRCKCTCLSYPKYNFGAQVYTGGVLSVDCNCLTIVVPVLNVSVVKEADLEPYCLRCECKYEVRSTKTMQVVVCLFIFLVSVLVLYMLVMLVADPIATLIFKQRHRDDSAMELMSQTSSSSSLDRKAATSVFQRVNQVQSRWKRQVENQRSNVFDRQEMLQ